MKEIRPCKWFHDWSREVYIDYLGNTIPLKVCYKCTKVKRVGFSLVRPRNDLNPTSLTSARKEILGEDWDK